MSTKAFGEIETPVGWLRVTVEYDAVVEVAWRRAREHSDHPVVRDALAQLAEYFDGTRTAFDLPLAPKGGSVLQGVLAQMLATPFGETTTYGDIAKQIGAPAQAVGQACGANPIPVIIPCHRVLGATNLGGYSGRHGIETKVALLKHEGAAGLLI